jgi:hypothetical protein
MPWRWSQRNKAKVEKNMEESELIKESWRRRNVRRVVGDSAVLWFRKLP